MHTSTHSIPGKNIFCMILSDLADLNVSYFHMCLESLIPGLGRSPGERNSYPLLYSGLENSMGCIPWGRRESDTPEQLSLFQKISQEDILRLSILTTEWVPVELLIILKTKLLSASLKWKDSGIVIIVLFSLNQMLSA